MNRRWTALILLPLLSACTGLPATPPTSSTPDRVMTKDVTAAAALHALFDREWERTMRENPEAASYMGDARYNDRWADLSPAAIEASHQADLAVLQTLAEIDREALPANEQTNYDLFQRQYQLAAEAHAFKPYLMPLNQRGGIQTQDELLEVLRFNEASDYEQWLSRLQALPTLVAQTEVLMRDGIREARLQPAVIMQRIPAQLDKQLTDDPTASPFYKPFLEFPDGIDADTRTDLETRAQRVIAEQVIPAYRDFKTFFVNEYLPACPPRVGIWQQPGGDEYYAFLARQFTTTTLTPEQIHQIGLSEVKRIRAQMDEIIDEVGFDGDFAAFAQFLRTDPRFYYDNGDDLLEAYQALSKRIDPELPRLFKTIPRLPYGVRPIPDNIAPDTTTAYYMPGAPDGSRAGYYYVNLYKPEMRPTYEMEALSLHESVPGHHFQIARAQELGELPKFRKNSWGMTAYIEGWGLYPNRWGRN